MASIKLKGDTSGEVTISAPAVAGTTTLELPATSSTIATHNSLGVRNRIINGDMRIDQRNSGSSVTYPGATIVGSNLYVIDRFTCNSTGSTRFSVQRSTTAPQGFTNSALITTTTSGSPGAADACYFGQYIEGFNVADAGFGTATAQAVTISFWVRSSLTGLFGGTLGNEDFSRRYAWSFTISAADTWEYKTITIPGDTTGTWSTTETRGFSLLFNLGSGSSSKGAGGAWGSSPTYPSGTVDLVVTAGATLNITGVQLEVGTEATPFEHRPYDMELQRCQRYYEVLYNQWSNIGILSATLAGTVTTSWCTWFFKQNKRAVPTFALGSGTAWVNQTPDGIWVGLDNIGFTNGTSYFYSSGPSGTPSLTASAEL